MHRCSVDENCGKIYVPKESIAAKNKAEKTNKQKPMRVALNVSASNNLFVALASRVPANIEFLECFRLW